MKKEYLQKTIFVLTVIGALTVLVLFISGIVHAVRWITAEPPQTKHISAGQAEQGVISEKTVMEILRPAGDLVTVKDAYPVLRWNMDNIFIKRDPAGNIKPDKEKSTEKIDGTVATIMALDRAIRCGNDTGDSIYDERDLLVL